MTSILTLRKTWQSIAFSLRLLRLVDLLKLIIAIDFDVKHMSLQTRNKNEKEKSFL